MIRALVWKEYREHRAVWLTLALVSGAGLYGLSRLMEPGGILSSNSAHESLMSIAVLFAWTYGLVCGAMLLANETESGTLAFLDMLPVQRVELWLVKCLFGLLLLVTQVVVLSGVVLGLGITETRAQLLATMLAMLFFGGFAMAWSLLFSARGDNVLNVIGLSFVGQITGGLGASVLLMPVAFVLDMIWRGNGELFRLALTCLAGLGLLVGPILGSARLFTRLDRERRQRRHAGPNTPTLESRSRQLWTSWLRLLWLSYTQMRQMLVGLAIFALLLGFALPWLGPLAWPALTLLVGVLCGVTAWSDEQLSGSFRFLGDQRLPLGRVWLTKLGMRFAMALFAALLLLLPSLVLAIVHQVGVRSQQERLPFFADLLHSDLIGPIVPVGTHLSLYLLYGFTVGHLCGMLFRKSLVAGVVALGMTGLLVSLWVPSLLGIGLHFWQTAGVPLMLLVAGRLLMPAWTADQLASRGTIPRLGLPLLVAGLWTASGLWYRVAEVPDVPEPYDTRAFAASIPTLDPGKNEAGMAIRGVWGQVDTLTHELYSDRSARGEPRDGNAPRNMGNEVQAVLRHGWPRGPSRLGDWLDARFQEEWYARLAEVPDMPLGAVEDARQLTFDMRGLSKWGDLVSLNRVLAVRGLQEQARGKPQVFVDNLRIGLSVSRNLQHLASPWTVRAGRRGEFSGVEALDRWLENLPNDRAALQAALDALLKHEAELPDVRDAARANYLIAQNSLESVPEKLIDLQVRDPNGRLVDRLELHQAEMEMTALFWRIPWERQRHERILRVAFQGDRAQRRQAEKWGGVALAFLPDVGPGPRSRREMALLHAAQLKVALRLYQARNEGKLPATLNDLVPACLPAIPVDPFAGQPFRYRVSGGEKLDWPEEPPPPGAGGPGALPGGLLGQPPGMPPGGPPVPPAPPVPPVKTVPAGQAILWSVGEDGHDDGGTRQGLFSGISTPGEDFIYLVPPPR